jgi:hypothetical protein
MSLSEQKKAKCVRKFLKNLRKSGVKVRKDLEPFVLDGYGFLQEETWVGVIFREKGWIPFDPEWKDTLEWQNAQVILTKESIDQAIERLKTPGDQKWSYGLFSDHKDKND